MLVRQFELEMAYIPQQQAILPFQHGLAIYSSICLLHRRARTTSMQNKCEAQQECYERFALQATALGIKNAFLNQPVEVSAVRPQFAASLGIGLRRPDLVVRFGRGKKLLQSLRRPVKMVLI